MPLGTVRCWFDAHGFGFVIPEPPYDGTHYTDDVFVHRHAIQGAQYLSKGETVSFEWGWNVKKSVYQRAR